MKVDVFLFYPTNAAEHFGGLEHFTDCSVIESNGSMLTFFDSDKVFHMFCGTWHVRRSPAAEGAGE